MSKSAISVSAWAEMSEAQRIERVRDGQATLKELVEGLLDGPKNLRDACRVFLMQSDVCLRRPSPQPCEPIEQPPQINHEQAAALLDGARKRRQGLPQGYVPRLHRH
jgi:hypothetical protein